MVSRLPSVLSNRLCADHAVPEAESKTSTRHSRILGSRILAGLMLPSLFLLSACAVAPPSGPSVAVMPGNGKSLPQFQQDDATCRQFATQQTGGASPAAAANQAAVGSAVVGTGIGAATGALLGAAAGNPGIGAAAGAGAGLLMGSAVGASNAGLSADEVQQRYDIAYQQCMAASGNKTQPAAEPVYAAPTPTYAAPVYAPPVYAPPVYAAPVYPAYPYYYPAYPYYPAYAPYGYYGPQVGATFVFGFGHGYHGRYHRW